MFVGPTGTRRVKVDLHMHTYFSKDSCNSFEGIIRTCERKGLDVICVTDHDEIEGALRLRDISPLPVIVGQEIYTSAGELLAYFIEERIPARLSPEEAIERIREQNGVVSIPHPFDAIRREAIERATLHRIIDKVDALEVFNARCLWSGCNQKAGDLARERGLLATAGSDAHTLGEIGCAYLELPAFSNREEFLESLRRAEVHGRLSVPLVHLVSTFNKRIRPLIKI